MRGRGRTGTGFAQNATSKLSEKKNWVKYWEIGGLTRRKASDCPSCCTSRPCRDVISAGKAPAKMEGQVGPRRVAAASPGANMGGGADSCHGNRILGSLSQRLFTDPNTAPAAPGRTPHWDMPFLRQTHTNITHTSNHLHPCGLCPGVIRTWEFWIHSLRILTPSSIDSFSFTFAHSTKRRDGAPDGAQTNINGAAAQGWCRGTLEYASRHAHHRRRI